MKKNFLLVFLLLGLMSCGKQDPSAQLKNLNGYWQIDRVKFSEDSIRKFGFSENIDYLEISDSIGFRKKVRPQLDGTYKVFGNQEKIRAKVENNHLYLYYTTPYTTWKETVLEADKDNMTLKNKRGYIYFYKRYSPISEKIKDDEKE